MNAQKENQAGSTDSNDESQQRIRRKTYRQKNHDRDQNPGKCINKGPDCEDWEGSQLTPERTPVSAKGHQERSSERIHARKNREFRMPTKKDVFDAIDDIPLQRTPRGYKSRERAASFTRSVHRYNQDVFTDEESSLDDFINDNEDVTSGSSDEDPDSHKQRIESRDHSRTMKRSNSVRKRIRVNTSSSSEEAEIPTPQKKVRRRILPSDSSEEEETQDPKSLPNVAERKTNVDILSPSRGTREENSQSEEVQSDASESLISHSSFEKTRSVRGLDSSGRQTSESGQTGKSLGSIKNSSDSSNRTDEIESNGNPREDLREINLWNSDVPHISELGPSTINESSSKTSDDDTKDDASDKSNVRYYDIFYRPKNKSKDSTPVKAVVAETPGGYDSKSSIEIVSDDESSIVIESDEEVNDNLDEIDLGIELSSEVPVLDSIITESDEEFENLPLGVHAEVGSVHESATVDSFSDTSGDQYGEINKSDSEDGNNCLDSDSEDLDLSRADKMKKKKDVWRSKFDVLKEQRQIKKSKEK